MTQQQIKNSFFICLSIFIFLIDISLFGLLHRHIFLLLHCFVILLMAQQYQNRIIFPPLFLLCLLSYLDTNIFGSCLLYMLPTLFLAKYFQEHLQTKIAIPYLLLISSLLLKKQSLFFMTQTEISWYNFVILTISNLLCLLIFTIIHNRSEPKAI